MVNRNVDNELLMDRYMELRAGNVDVPEAVKILNAEFSIDLTQNAFQQRWKRYKLKHDITDIPGTSEPANLEILKRQARLKYLKKGRTLATFCSHFAHTSEEAAPYLERDAYEGYEVWQSRNRYNQDCWIAIPKPPDRDKPQPKIWTYTIAPPPQPWIWVHIPDDYDAKVLKIFLLADMHEGGKTHARVPFLNTINYIAEHDNAFAFGVGDWLENALKTSIGAGVYEQELPPLDQIQTLERDILVIAHKIFYAQRGNHEYRTYQSAGICPLRILCERLDIPYFADQVHMTIFWKGHQWEFFSFHGKTSSRTKGGKINEAMRPRNFQEFVNFRVMAHVHDQIGNPVVKMRRNHQEFKIEFLTEHIVIAPSFLDYFGSYASEAAMEPGHQGAVCLAIYPDGDYKVDPWGE